MSLTSRMRTSEPREVLTCIVCHGKVYMYDDRFKPGEKVYWCPTCKKEGRKFYYKIADLGYE